MSEPVEGQTRVYRVDDEVHHEVWSKGTWRPLIDPDDPFFEDLEDFTGDLEEQANGHQP